MVSLRVACFVLASLCLLSSAWIFWRETRDPRWRDFDFSSRQATYNEVYIPTEMPALQNVRRVGERTLELQFDPPVDTSGWTVIWHVLYQPEVVETIDRVEGRHPRVTFPSDSARIEVRLEPDGVKLVPPMVMRMAYDHSSVYTDEGLDWPDNFWFLNSSHPVKLSGNRWSLRDWVGMKEDDPDLKQARAFLEGKYDPSAHTLEKIEQISLLTWNIANTGTPDTEVSMGSPAVVLQRMLKGDGQGWCEDWALVYYLLANAANVPTRMVDISGMLGPMKLCGHYFNESWVPELGQWAYVDVNARGVLVHNEDRTKVYNTHEMTQMAKKDLYRAVHWTGIEGRYPHIGEEREEAVLVTKPAHETYIPRAFESQGVLAYKFGYTKNSTQSTLHTYLFRPTLLLSDFQVPPYFYWKRALLHGIWVFALVGVAAWMGSGLVGKRSGRTVDGRRELEKSPSPAVS